MFINELKVSSYPWRTEGKKKLFKIVPTTEVSVRVTHIFYLPFRRILRWIVQSPLYDVAE